ncbi:MAG: GAF domain-containing protein, partial [Thermomicrobiales bacterium]|nr:GAF domain-containing protein [Thermomicrobiales bacterium]
MSAPRPDPDAYANHSEPFFVIDQRQRVVEWSAAASALLGIAAPDAIGRPCFDVLQGTNEQGEPVCRADCLAVSALDEGGLSAGAALIVGRGPGQKRRIRCQLAALPHAQGALATLSERSKSAESSAVTPPRERRTDMSADLLHTLLAFAHLSTSLAIDQLESSMEQALDLLRKATGADSAELFLAEPTSHDALLTAYRGPFARSFCQLMRFSPGEGFPGVVIERHEPMVSSSLPNDVRFLREEVKKKGYRSYVCVPLLAAQQVVGAIGVGARHPDFSTEDALRLLTWSSAPMAIAVQAGLMQASRSAMPSLPAYHGTAADLDLFLHSVLQQARYLAGADAGTITVFGRNGTEIARRIADGVDPSLAGCCPDRGEHQQGCPALNGGHGIALWGPRRHWAPPCQHFSQPGRAAYCLPMRHNDENAGLIQLVYHDSAPLPPTRHVGLLLEYASQVSSILAVIARDLEERSNPSFPVLSPDPSVESRPPRTVQVSVVPVPNSEAPAHEPHARSEPFLQIRCLGPFEVVRN